MADLDLSISAQDRGARNLINQLIQAMRQLKLAADKANSGRESVLSARSTANALRQELLATQQLVRTRIEAHREARRIAAEEVRTVRQATAQKIAAIREENAKREALSGGGRDTQRQRVTEARNAIREEIENQKKLVAAVRQAANERVETQERLRKVAVDASRARVLDEQKRLNEFKRIRDAQRRQISDQIEIEKKIRDRQKQQVEFGPTAASRAKAAQQLAFSRQLIRDLREQRRESIESNRERVESQRGIVESEKANAAAVRKVRSEAVRDAISLGKTEIATAKQSAAQAVASAQQKLRSAQAELTTRQQNFRNLRAAGREEVAAARASGQAAVNAARIKNKADIAAAAGAVRSARATVDAKKRETLAAEQAARAQERAARRAGGSFRFQQQSIPGLIGLYQRLKSSVLQLAAAYAGFQAIRKFIVTGLEFNALIESSKLGIGALITAQADLIDQHGKMLTGTKALAAAQGLAAEQLDKLRVAGIQTIATTEELVQTFQETVGAGLNVGLTLDQIRKFSVLAAQAGAAINLPMNQLQQETRSILASTIDRNSRIAKTLQITNALVNKAKEEGRLFEFLNEKFQAFNVAGIESVKTWNALASNIKDTFAVFSGAAVEPLFIALRDAGQQALARIFDFDTAEIRDSFKGLIEGLQTIFEGVGDVFATAIRKAVDQAEALSRWFKENREEVRLTAIAIGGMVESMFNMVGAISKGIVEMISFGNQINVVAGAANVLNAAFEAIADNIKLIILLLASRFLVAVGGAIIGAIAGVASIPAGIIAGLTALVAAIVGVDFVTKVFTKTEKEATIEALRLGSALDDQRKRAAPLVEQWASLAKQLEDTNLSKEEAADLNKRLDETTLDLIETDEEYANVIGKGTGTVKERLEALYKLYSAQAQDAALQEDMIRQEHDTLMRRKADLESILKTRKDPAAKGEILTPEVAENTKRELGEIAERLEIVGVAMDAATKKTGTFSRTLRRLQEGRATVSPRKPPPEEGVGGEPQFIKTAKAQFDLFKQQIASEQERLDAQLQARIITGAKHIQASAELELMIIKAEQELTKILIAQAEKDLKTAEAAKDKATPEGKKKIQERKDALNALQVQEAVLKEKEKTHSIRVNAEILDNDRETLKKREELHIAYLQAIGQNLEAARRQIALEGEETIKDAINEFGVGIPAAVKDSLLKATGPEFQRLLKENFKLLGPGVQKVVITVDMESVQKQIDAIDDLIKNAEETRNREVEAIRARFAAKKGKGGLSDAELQEQHNLIAAANARAVAATQTLRAELETLRAGLDPKQFAGTIVIIDGLIARLDGLAAATENVNLKLEELKKGARDALEEGLATFLEGVGDSTRTLKGLFKEMVTSIINDLRRLSAQFLASSILDAIFKTRKTAATGQTDFGITGSTGGSTQSLVARAFQRRAGGGPGRPAHGVLRGGSYGRDSIPILAMADEYFINRKATRYYGPKFIDLINQQRIPLSWANEVFSLMHSHWSPRPIRDRHHFAQGGAVTGGRSGGARPAVPQTVNHLIGIDENGLIGFLNSRGGRQIVLGHVSSAPRLIANMPRSLKRAR